MPISIINPKIVSENTLKILNKLGEGYNKYTQSKWGKPIHEFFVGKDMDLSDEEYMQKYGYGKPLEGLGVAGLVTPASAPKVISGVGKITDLNKFKKVNFKLSDPDNYYTFMHATDPKSLENIMNVGFKYDAGDLSRTVTFESGEFPERLMKFVEGTANDVHSKFGGAAIIRIPKTELPDLTGKPLYKIFDALDDRFMNIDTGILEIPPKYISGLLKTQLKQGGILKRR